MLEEMMEAVREYSYELNPSTVERAGLRPALDRLFSRVRARFLGTLRLNVDPSLKLDPKVASSMYQIAQEAVENARATFQLLYDRNRGKDRTWRDIIWKCEITGRGSIPRTCRAAHGAWAY